MGDSFQKADVPQISRQRPLAPLLFLLLLTTLGTLFIEHWRGERALRTWKNGKAAQGEILDPNRLWPAPVPSSREFSNQLAEAVKRLPISLTQFAGSLSGLSQDELGRPSRGSQQARPPLSYEQNNVSTWQELETASREAQPAIKTIRKLMKNPPRAMDTAITKRLDYDGFPYLLNVRRSSRALHAAVIMELHQGNLEAALENLEALQGCVRTYADDPMLVNYMFRVAIIGLGSDACWDALQDDRWSEAQLLRLQQACQANALFPQMPKAMAAERVARIHAMNWFASHSYQAWVDRFADIHKSFGSNPAELDTANWNGLWRKWIFHPAWSFAWRAQDELGYLNFSQQDLDILQEAVKRGSWAYLKEGQTTLRNNYRRAATDWRFYRPLPLHDIMIEIAGGGRAERTECPYPDFSRAWFVAAKNLTRHEMVTTVIALKRHQLREGKMPNALAALVPAYLDALPRDLMDGQPLRYRLKVDGSFVLYSVGENAQDEGGHSRPFSRLRAGPSDSDPTQPRPDSWSGRDWVWPQAR